MADRLREARPRLHFLPFVTLSAMAAVLVTAFRFGVIGGSLPAEVGFRYGFTARSPRTGDGWRIVTSQFLTRDTFMAASIAISLLVMLGAYEAIAGHRRAALVALIGGLLGPLGVAAGLGAWSLTGNAFAARTLSTLDYGASTITAAGGGALVAVLGDRRLRWGAVVFVIAGLVVHHQLADWEHLVAFPAGYCVSRWLGVPAPLGGTALRGGVRGRGVRTPVLLPNGGLERGWRPTALAAAAVLAVGAGAAASPLLIVNRTVAASQRSLSPVRLVDTTFPSAALGMRRRVLIALPAGYDGTRGRFPVVELLHGLPGRPEDLFVGGDLIGLMSSPAMPPFIAVVPDGRGPIVTNGDFADTSKQLLGTAMSDDLRRWVSTTYRTTGWWGVAGVSAGGYGAVYLAARPGHAYRAACAIAGYFEARPPAFAGESRAVRDEASPILHPSRDGPATLLIVLRSDHHEVVDAQRYSEALKAVGRQTVVETVGGPHEWSTFRRDLPGCVDFALTAGARPVSGRPA